MYTSLLINYGGKYNGNYTQPLYYAWIGSTLNVDCDKNSCFDRIYSSNWKLWMQNNEGCRVCVDEFDWLRKYCVDKSGIKSGLTRNAFKIREWYE